MSDSNGSLRNRNVLVTGAPGWLSDVVLSQLAEHAPRIRCLVQRTLPQSSVDKWRPTHPEVTDVLSGDMGDAASINAAVKGLDGGVVLHAAGVIHPRRTTDWYTINRDGTLALARAAKAEGMKRFVFVSSNAAQGASSSAELLLTEEMACKPLSHYGRSKYEAEQGLMALHEPGKFEIVVARPCMFYGPPVPQRHIDIFKRIRDGRLPLVGSGGYARSLSYVDDLAAGIVLCMQHPKAAGEIFNICDAKAYTTRQVCEAMASALGVAPKFLPLPALSATVAYGIDCVLAAGGFYAMNFHLLGEANWNVGCSSRKATDLLGFTPKISLEDGYRRAIGWCNERKLL